MLNWSDYMIQQERYKSLLAEAETERLLLQPDAQLPRKRNRRMHRRAMAALGRRLVAWGWRLQGANDHAATMAR
jgi:hypothetical protein